MTVAKYMELSDRISALELAVERLAVQMEYQSRLINMMVKLYTREETE